MDPDVKECLKLSDRGSYYNQAELQSDQSSDSGENNDDCIVNVSATSKKLKLEPQCSDSGSSSTELLANDSDAESVTYSSNEEENEDLEFTKYSRTIMHLGPLAESVKNASVCKNCNVGDLKLTTALEKQRGLCCELAWVCNNCENKVTFYSDTNTGQGTKNFRDVNALSVLAMRTIGKSRNALLKFCAMMDLPDPVSSNPYTDHTKDWAEKAAGVCEEMMNEAASELKRLKIQNGEWDGEGTCECAVTVDGSWAHTGYSSRHGFVSVISVDTGKVLDYVTLSNECRLCKKWERSKQTTSRNFLEWFVTHEEKCTLNHQGSAKSMEAEGAVLLFARSEMLRGLRYTTYVGDGDSAAYGSVVDARPYGPDIVIKKEDCVGHIQGRMGKHLRRLVDQHKGEI